MSVRYPVFFLLLCIFCVFLHSLRRSLFQAIIPHFSLQEYCRLINLFILYTFLSVYISVYVYSGAVSTATIKGK